jgi:UV DNA damage endonuclease
VIRLGYACINMTLGRKMRSMRLSTLRLQGRQYLQQLVDENLDLVADILRWNRSHQIMVFRLSSDLVPLGSHEEVDLTALQFGRAQEIMELAYGMRLSMHPGQYTLPSAVGTVWERSFKDLCYHAFTLNQLGMKNGDLILHGGGVYGDRQASTTRIIEKITSLPENVRSRLRLENDERSWSVDDLLPICKATGTPLVVDWLHHQLNGREPFSLLPWEQIWATWHGQRPKLHYSEQDPTKRAGAHSHYVNAHSFQTFCTQVPLTDYDVMLECKAKEQALLRLRKELGIASQELER